MRLKMLSSNLLNGIRNHIAEESRVDKQDPEASGNKQKIKTTNKAQPPLCLCHKESLLLKYCDLANYVIAATRVPNKLPNSSDQRRVFPTQRGTLFLYSR
jgi:hypothetical protein